MLLPRCSKSALLTAAMWLILAGCGAKQGLQSTGMSGPVGGFSYPQVFQTGKTPVNWTQFKWGDTTFGPAQYNDITTAGGNIWYTDYSGNKLMEYGDLFKMTEGEKFRCRVPCLLILPARK